MSVALRASLLLLGLLLAATAQAHTRGSSYSFWILNDTGAEVRARVSQLELTRLHLHPDQADYLEQGAARLSHDLQLWSQGQPCAVSGARARLDGKGWMETRWVLHCEDPRDLTLRTQLFADVAPTHLHYARVQRIDGTVREQVLSLSAPALVLTEVPPSVGHALHHYLVLGVEHILSGWDHLAFVLALILLATRLRDIALIATGFTLAHSLTLALATLGWVRPEPAPVEALIGFSIALVAAENLWLRSGRERWLPWALAAVLLGIAALDRSTLPVLTLLGLALFCASYFPLLAREPRTARLRLSLAFVFGLVHGFGFAGALSELQLPPERLALGLVGFNLGVEAGQLLVIAAIWPLLQWVRRRERLGLWINDGAAAIICALGTYWFVVRSFALS